MRTDTMTFGARLLQFENHLHGLDRSPATIKSYLSDLKVFAVWHGATYGNEPDAVLALDICGFRQHCLVDLRQAPATINRRIATLRIYCTWQSEKGLTPTDEGAKVKPVKAMPAPAPGGI